MRYCFVATLAIFLLCGCLKRVDAITDVHALTNTAPTISEIPVCAVLNTDIYEFQSNASDHNGDRLTFQIGNKPSWAEFDSASGAIGGHPTMANIGMYDNIIISVSDDTLVNSLATFSITISQGSLGAITLDRFPPTLNADGSIMQNLAGYNIFAGKRSGTYLRNTRVDNSGLTSCVINNLIPDTYYVVATALNASGVESTFSDEVVEIVNK